VADAAGAAVHQHLLAGCTRARSTRPSQAVMKISGRAAAWRMSRLRGLWASRSASTAANWASEPGTPPMPPVMP
jgi:hypothetical protein